MDLLNICKGSGAPTDERNKVVFFLNALEPNSLNRKIVELHETEYQHQIWTNNCILELGQQLLRQKVAKENFAAPDSLIKDTSDPPKRQQHDTEVNRSLAEKRLG